MMDLQVQSFVLGTHSLGSTTDSESEKLIPEQVSLMRNTW